jgi:WD40 repeat protein
MMAGDDDRNALPTRRANWASNGPGEKDSSLLSACADSFGFGGDDAIDLPVGTDLGGVTIVRLLAEGGMGRVYEGRQQAPSRPVAVKVLRNGLTNRATARRFAQEAQLLARLRHPHIAQVHTLGEYRHEGLTLPFFVLELVEGALPIDRFVADRQLSVRERVKLMQRVAEAVAHGHRLGVVHRDLKPGNILVGLDGEPKVIDFGVARFTDVDLAWATIQTEAGRIVGTLRYMSPEQFDGDVTRISAATDVYALGLVLHELLTGSLPYEVRGKPLAAAARIVRDQEAEAERSIPRALVGAAGIAAGAARRLAAVVEKCLRKRPDDRYVAADLLAAELDRWLAGETVLARPASPVERAGRWARRRSLPLTAAILATLVLAAGTAAVVSSARARQQRDVARRTLEEKQTESYYALLERVAAAARRRNVADAARLLERARAVGGVVPGHPLELDCLAAELDDAIAVMECHDGSVRAVAASPDGRRLVTGADDGRIGFWEMDESRGGRQVAVVTGHEAPVWSAAIGADGRRAVTAAEDGTAIVWEIATAAVARRLAGHAKAIYGVCIAPAGDMIATASGDGTVQLFDAASGAIVRTIRPAWRPGATDRNVYGVAFAPDGSRLAAACGDQMVRLWDPRSGGHVADIAGHGRRVFAVAFAPDGTQLASASEDGTARIWRGSETATTVLKHPLRVNAVSWTADGSELATVSADGVVRLWDGHQMTAGDPHPIRVLAGHRGAIWGITRLPREQFATVSTDGTMRVWDPLQADDGVLRCGEGPAAGVRGVACSPDGQLIATATADGRVRLWGQDATADVRDLPAVRSRVNAVAFSPAGDLLAAGAGDGVVRVCHTSAGGWCGERRLHDGPAFAVAFSPDGRWLATAGGERDGQAAEAGAVKVVDAGLGAAATVELPHPARAHAAAWSADGRQLATACADGLARIWDVASGELVATFTGHQDDVNWVAWSPQGGQLATAASDGTVRLWEVDGGAMLEVFREPVGQVWEVAFSPDGTRLAGVAADGCLHLWHVDTRRHLLAIPGHDGAAWALAFAADGRTIVTGADDGTARLWGLAPAAIHRLRAGAPSVSGR